MAIQGLYVRTDLATLATLRANTISAINDVLVAHQSYGMAGRNIQRAQLSTLTNNLAEIDYGIAYQGGTIPRSAVPDMSGGYD
jgi:hypothetical protein